VPSCSASDTDFLLVDYSSGTIAAVEGTSSGIAADADAGSGAGILEGDSACTAWVDCLRNGEGCYFRSAIHQSCASGLPYPDASSSSL
jgi:hypothetical protein